MSIHINMENYEEFYLDFLEGNLSGEALSAFEQFMAEHPGLEIEGGMISLQPDEEMKLGSLNKLLLRHHVPISELSQDTYTYFIIAQQEGLLNASENQQLNDWLKKHPAEAKEAALFAAARLEADFTVVYEDKEGLKKKEGKVIPLFWTSVAAAAGLALIITLSWRSEAPEGSQVVSRTEDADSVIPKRTSDSSKANGSGQTVTGNDADFNSRDQTQVAQQSGINPGGEKPENPDQRIPLVNPAPVYPEVSDLAVNKVQRISHGHTQPAKMDLPAPSPKYEAPENSDVAALGIDQMKNPIKPITQSISEKFETPIDFRTAKAAKRQGGGFYFRLGKLEISHNTASL